MTSVLTATTTTTTTTQRITDVNEKKNRLWNQMTVRYLAWFTLWLGEPHMKNTQMKERMNECMNKWNEWKNERNGDKEKSAANTKSTRGRRKMKTNLFIGIYYMLISYFQLSIRWQQLLWSSSCHRRRRHHRRRRYRTHKMLLLLQPVQSEES